MQLKHKIAALSILPLLLAVAVVCALVLFQNQRLGEQQAKLIESCLHRYDKSYSGFKDLGGKMMAMGQAMGGMMVNDEIVKGAQMGYVFENLEIASYEILIAAANAVGDTQTAEICTRILAEEVAMAEWMRSHLAELTQAYLTRAETPNVEAKR